MINWIMIIDDITIFQLSPTHFKSTKDAQGHKHKCNHVQQSDEKLFKLQQKMQSR